MGARHGARDAVGPRERIREVLGFVKAVNEGRQSSNRIVRPKSRLPGTFVAAPNRLVRWAKRAPAAAPVQATRARSGQSPRERADGPAQRGALGGELAHRTIHQ